MNKGGDADGRLKLCNGVELSKENYGRVVYRVQGAMTAYIHDNPVTSSKILYTLDGALLNFEFPKLQPTKPIYQPGTDCLPFSLVIYNGVYVYPEFNKILNTNVNIKRK